MSAQNIYFYEGECEEKLIKSLKSNAEMPAGKTRKANFWEIIDINKIIRLYPKNKVSAYVVFDTDTITNIDRFNVNILALSRNFKKVVLLPQHSNFEDEIAYACNIKVGILPKQVFGVKCDTPAKFKSRIIKDNQLLDTLRSKGFDLQKLWCRTTSKNIINVNRKNIKWR